MSRNPNGIDIDVFAATGDKAPLIGSETDGWGLPFQVNQGPPRQNFNYLMNQQNAVLTDVNKGGAALPWDDGITYSEDAVVTFGGEIFIALSSTTNNEPSGGNIGVFWAYSKLQIQETIDTTTGVAASPNAVLEYVGDRLTPYYSVMVSSVDNLTLPGDFGSNPIIAEWDYLSRGELFLGPDPRFLRKNSVLFSMNVEALVGATIDFRLFKCDDDMYIYLDGVLQFTRSDFDNPNAPDNLSFAVSSGNRLIQVVANSQGSDDETLQMSGKIIQTNVIFREP